MYSTYSKYHNYIAYYFKNKPFYLDEINKKKPNIRKLIELPWQQLHGESWMELEATLTDLDFVEVKPRSGLIYDLLQNYIDAEQYWPGQKEERNREETRKQRTREYIEKLISYAKNSKHLPLPIPVPLVEIRQYDSIPVIHHEWTPLDRIKAWGHFVNTHIPQLIESVEPLFQLAWNSSASGPITDMLEKMLDHRVGPQNMWLRLRNRPIFSPNPACLKVLDCNDPVYTVGVTADAGLAVSGDSGGTIRVWNLKTSKCLHVIHGHKGYVNSICVTPDGKYALSGSIDSTLRLWNIATGECLKVMGNQKSSIRSVCMTADARLAVSGGDGSAIHVWDLTRGECLKVLQGHSGSIRSVSITPDGHRVISGSENSTLSVWDLATEVCLKESIIEPPESAWITTHDEVTAETINRPMPRGPIEAVAISSDGQRVVSIAYGSLHVWNLVKDEFPKIMQASIQKCSASISITPDATRAVCGDGNARICIWNLESGECLKALEGHNADICSVSMIPDGGLAVSGAYDDTICVWDLAKGESLKQSEEIDLHYNAIQVVSFTPNGKRALSGGQDSVVRVWDWNTGECLKLLKGHTSPIRAISITSDGDRVVTGSHDGALRLWNLNSGECLKVLKGNSIGEGSYGVRSITITPDDALMVTANEISDVCLWDLRSGECLKQLEGYSDSTIQLSPDGRWAVAYWRNKIGIWDLAMDQSLKILEGHTEWINALLITPDGRIVVSKSTDKTIRFWDFTTGECLKVLDGCFDSSNVFSAIKNSEGSIFTIFDNTSCELALKTSFRPQVLTTADLITSERGNSFRVSHNNTLRIRDPESIDSIMMGAIGTVFESIAIHNNRLIAGEKEGRVDMITIENYNPKLSRVTASRLWIYGSGVTSGHWDDNISAVCVVCGKRFPVSDSILEKIAIIILKTNIGPDLAPCSKLPVEAWEEQQLVSECPLCHEPLKFNPFVVDNKNKKI